MPEEVIAVGQRWVSRDPRDNRRTVEVVHVGFNGDVDTRNVETGRTVGMKQKTLRSRFRLAFDQESTS